MYTIGSFARLGRVSTKTLRLYGQLGLIAPARVDPQSGYRYYSLEQLPRLHRILAFKSLGFSLDQIAQLLDAELSVEQLRDMLQRRRQELQAQMVQTQDRLAHVEARLNLLEQEPSMPSYDVAIKSVEAVSVASIRDTIPTYAAVGQLFGELQEYFARHSLQSGDFCAAIWHDGDYREADVDAEAAIAAVGVPRVELPIVTGRVALRTLPALPAAASTIHHGPYQTLNLAYASLTRWIDANDYEIVGPNREIYLRGGPEQLNPDYVTEIQFPVGKRRPSN